MRPRRSLPLGSPSRKETPEGDESHIASTDRSSTEAASTQQTTRVRTRQIPLSSRPKDSNDNPKSSKRSRRTSRGLPLSRASSHTASSDNSPKDLPDVPVESQTGKKKLKDPPIVAGATMVKQDILVGTSGKGKYSADRRLPATGAVSSKKRSIPKHGKKSSSLSMIDREGSEVFIKLIVNQKEFKISGEEQTQKFLGKRESLGNDGNQFNCEVCAQYGDVCCCDGCPKVYHRDCIPRSHPSRESLENDDDPWFCPSCVEERQTKARIPSIGRASRRSPTVESVATAKKGPLVEEYVDYQCSECGKRTGMPYCNETGFTLCSECFAAENEVDPQEDDDDAASEELSQPVLAKRSERKRKSTAYEEEEKPDKGPKKKKRKKKVRTEPIDTTEQPPPPPPEPSGMPFPGFPTHSKTGIAQATPAFYFYLQENRSKIERVLARRHRNFNRLGKGSERNAMIAQEAAIWWSKLPPVEQKPYMNMSMREFEGRIIEWKEDKSIREMNTNDVDVSEQSSALESRLLEEDEKLQWKRHQRLYHSTSVGSKPFKPEPDQAYNRVLQDLLHDMRFHPLPMLAVHRPEEEEEKDDVGAKVLIPYFDVHGPPSTSVGDACMGCIRSWNHFCPVLQRRVPAVEHRAKLQPPMSSLLATRVGLGLRPRLEEEPTPPGIPDDDLPVFTWRKSNEREEMLDMKIYPSCTLTTPNERMDDVVMFVEETTAMKVPEPPKPEGSSKMPLRTLPLSLQSSDESKFKKCGRCRAIIQGDTGCVQCRRAQLVINMAKRQKQDGKLLKVHTSMLGRYNTKDPSEAQSEDDAAVAAAMLKERWTPSVVLAPEPKYVPRPSNGRKGSFREDRDSKQAENGHRAQEWPTTGGQSTDEQQEVRQRPSRATTSAQDVFEPHERQEIMEKNRRAVNAFQKKLVSIACCGMFQALIRRDPLKLFDQPVSDDAYYDVVKHPMFLCNIREKILNNQYASLGAFANDIKQLCDNALGYNLPNTIYAKTATELSELFNIMHKRAGHWVTALKDAYANYLNSQGIQSSLGSGEDDEIDNDAFSDIRRDWPEAYKILKSSEWLRSHVSADFLRTEENEIPFFGSLAVSRVAVSAEACLAPYTDVSGSFGVVTKRTEQDDRELRERIDGLAGKIVGPIDLSTPSTWREESVHRLLRKVQSRRLDRMTASEQGCARCDGLNVDQDVKLTMKAEAAVGKVRKTEEADLPRVDGSRIDLTTGRGSANARAVIAKRRKESEEKQVDSVMESCVSVRGSRIHGLGLYADQDFKKGDIVAEYVGEYISNEEFEAREGIYRENRTQDYSFRIDSELVIDATLRGGPGRYSNHDCNPNCASKIIPGKEPTPHLKRVFIVAMRGIKINEEITYDYQFPLEQDLSARIPCNCRSDSCRGFMNWDLPEKGSNNRVVLVQKRGANMRDRIRRLNRPLKRDEL